MKETTEITFYLEGIPASKSDPFTVSAEGKEVVTLKEALKGGLQKTYKIKVEPNDYENEQLYVTVHLGMTTKGVDFKQRINITIGGKHIMIKFNEGKFSISTSRDPFQRNFGEKREDNSPKKENLFVKIVKSAPFRIFIGHKFIYKLKKEVKGSKEVDLSIKLSNPSQFVHLRLLDAEEDKELLVKKVNVGETGEYLKISRENDDFKILQKTEDGKYEEPEESKPDVTETKLYLLNIDFDKEDKLAVYLDKKRIHTLSSKTDEIPGVKVDLDNDDLKRKFTVKGGKDKLNEVKELDISKGAHVLVTMNDDGKLEWKQSLDQFKFGYKKKDDGSKTIVVLEDSN